MSYVVKEIFKTVQGEGVNSGRVAVFLRFAGCNGWSGTKEGRRTGALICSLWCDTDFVGTNGVNGGKYETVALARKCSEVWGGGRSSRFVVLTGGEPTLQVSEHLVDVLHRWEFEVAIETNGTRKVPSSVDWITVSPKLGMPLAQTIGDELKLVYPQSGIDPESYAELTFGHFILQPKWVDDADKRKRYVDETVAYCMDHPEWRLGVQAHKTIGLP